MVDLVIKGKIFIPGNEDAFCEDFDKFLDDHKAHFDGSIKIYQFDDCEIVSDEKVED